MVSNSGQLTSRICHKIKIDNYIFHFLRLPYVEAFMAEAFRMSTLVYINVQRETSKDYNIGGYLLPKVSSYSHKYFCCTFDYLNNWYQINYRKEKFYFISGSN